MVPFPFLVSIIVIVPNHAHFSLPCNINQCRDGLNRSVWHVFNRLLLCWLGSKTILECIVSKKIINFVSTGPLLHFLIFLTINLNPIKFWPLSGRCPIYPGIYSLHSHVDDNAPVPWYNLDDALLVFYRCTTKIILHSLLLLQHVHTKLRVHLLRNPRRSRLQQEADILTSSPSILICCYSSPDHHPYRMPAFIRTPPDALLLSENAFRETNLL